MFQQDLNPHRDGWHAIVPSETTVLLGDAIAQWIRLHLRFCRPWFESNAHTFYIYSLPIVLYFSLYLEKDESKQKRVRVWTLKIINMNGHSTMKDATRNTCFKYNLVCACHHDQMQEDLHYITHTYMAVL